VVFLDALRVKIHDEGLVKNEAVYVALALNPAGEGAWLLTVAFGLRPLVAFYRVSRSPLSLVSQTS
jgi:hypothetical protein